MSEEIKETISQPINTLDQAKHLIINAARAQVLSIDWERFGQVSHSARGVFDGAYPTMLRNAGYPFALPLSTLDTDDSLQRDILDIIPTERKVRISNDRDEWLVLITNQISPDMATFIKDHLFLKFLDVMTDVNGLRDDAYDELRATDLRFSRAALRMRDFLTKQDQ